VELTYYNLAWAATVSGSTNILLYMDSALPYSDTGTFSGYPILAGYSYPPATNAIDDTTGAKQIVHQEYDDRAIQYWTNKAIVQNLGYNYRAFKSDYTDMLITIQHTIDYKADAGVVLDKAVFDNKKAEIRFSNPTGAPKNIYYCNVYGRVLYKSAERKCGVLSVVDTKKIDKYVSTFLYDAVEADIFTKALAALHTVDHTSYSFSSFATYVVGSVASVVTGDGVDQACLIISRAYLDTTKLWQYTVRAYDRNVGVLTYQSVSVSPAFSYNDPVLAQVQSDIDMASKYLKQSSNLILRDRADILTPATLTVSAMAQNDIPYAGRFVIETTHTVLISKTDTPQLLMSPRTYTLYLVSQR
jgi:hypothetical protein